MIAIYVVSFVKQKFKQIYVNVKFLKLNSLTFYLKGEVEQKKLFR